MAGIARLDLLIKTDRQRQFPFDFLVGWEQYETWDEAKVGASSIAPNRYKISVEDVIGYNLACGETDPLLVDENFARENSPTGEVLQHPLFASVLPFYCLGASGMGSWLRTPGARNPFQRIELFEAFRIGETISTHMTLIDKFIQRDKYYLTMLFEFRNEACALKARWHCSLIIPPTKAEVEKFANA